MNIAFIPVRGGSKSIPLKNIKEINGKPLVYWTAKAAFDAECIDKIVIATDSDKIKNVVAGFGFGAKLEIFERSSQTSTDTASTESVILEYIEKKQPDKDEYLFLIQATSPMLRAEHIDGMYKKFISSGADSIFSGVREKQFHWIEKEDEIVPVNYDYKNRPRRQDFEGLIAENGACYINSVKNILESKCRLSGRITHYELPAYTAYEIDEPIDWIIVEELMKKFN